MQLGLNETYFNSQLAQDQRLYEKGKLYWHHHLYGEAEICLRQAALAGHQKAKQFLQAAINAKRVLSEEQRLTLSVIETLEHQGIAEPTQEQITGLEQLIGHYLKKIIHSSEKN